MSQNLYNSQTNLIFRQTQVTDSTFNTDKDC